MYTNYALQDSLEIHTTKANAQLLDGGSGGGGGGGGGREGAGKGSECE